MLFESISVVLVFVVFALLLFLLSWVWEKCVEKLLKRISESTTRGELVGWVMIYVTFSIIIFMAEVFAISTLWEAIF